MCFSVGSGMFCCSWIHLYIPCMVHSTYWVWARLFASLCTPRGGTIAGFCLARDVGGRGQKSQWVKRLLGCVSARPWWGCRRTSPLTQQCVEEQPFSRLAEWHAHACDRRHTQSTKGAGEMKPFIHLPRDIWITGPQSMTDSRVFYLPWRKRKNECYCMGNVRGKMSHRSLSSVWPMLMRKRKRYIILVYDLIMPISRDKGMSEVRCIGVMKEFHNVSLYVHSAGTFCLNPILYRCVMYLMMQCKV